MIMRLIALTVVATASLVLCLIAAWLGTMLGDREPPIRVYSADILNTRVERGGTLRIMYRVNRLRSCHASADRILRDSANPPNRKPIEDIEIKPGADPTGDDLYVSTVELPEILVPGPATYTTVASYRCNLMHYIWPITTPPRVMHFTIIPREGDAAGMK